MKRSADCEDGGVLIKGSRQSDRHRRSSICTDKVQVWRPLETVHKDPLAVADARSVPDADLVPAAIHYPDGRRGETYTVRPGAGHRWFFKYAQRPDEVLVFKIFDSDTRVARRAPHSAFLDPEAEDRPSRRSVEVRSFVFYD